MQNFTFLIQTTGETKKGKQGRSRIRSVVLLCVCSNQQKWLLAGLLQPDLDFCFDVYLRTSRRGERTTLLESDTFNESESVPGMWGHAVLLQKPCPGIPQPQVAWLNLFWVLSVPFDWEPAQLSCCESLWVSGSPREPNARTRIASCPVFTIRWKRHLQCFPFVNYGRSATTGEEGNRWCTRLCLFDKVECGHKLQKGRVTLHRNK